MALVPQQILEQIELAAGQLDRPITANHAARDEVDLEIGGLESKDVGRASTTQQRANARQQFRQRERFDQIVVGAAIQAEHTIIDPVTCGQNQDR